MAAEDTRRGTWFERNAWTVFTGITLVVVLFGLGDIVGGGSTFELGETVLFNRLTGTTWNGASDGDQNCGMLWATHGTVAVQIWPRRT